MAYIDNSSWENSAMDREEFSSELYRVVKKNIDALDCYHLLEGGAPDDEFDIETDDICRKIKPECCTEDIAEIIAEVFMRWLGVEYSKEKLLPMSEEIALVCQKYSQK